MVTSNACAILAPQHNDTVRHYGPAKAAAMHDLLAPPCRWLKLQAMAPYFVRQQTDASCSVASVTTVLNTVRAQSRKRAVLQDQVLQSDPSGLWAQATKDAHSDGVNLEGLALHVMQSFYTQASRHVAVDVRRMGLSRGEFRAALEHALGAGEDNPHDHFMIVNVLQSRVLGDGEPMGHMSVVGAWDAKRQRVLILDVDNRKPDPYWVAIETLIDAMNTTDDVTGERRGYLLIRLGG